ncbi:MAG: GGDEF domain-containing protein [Desulfobacterales bacterium]|jgi:diguanylate cyclase (GGDEF)-like protein
MAIFTSLIHEKYRRNFLVFFILSSTLPLLFMMSIIFQHVIPVLMPQQIADLRPVFTYGVLLMLVPTFLSFVLGSLWIRTVEDLTKEIKSKTVRITGEQHQYEDQNEFSTIHQSFNDLHNELRNKINQLNDVSKKLIDSNVRLNELATTDDLTSLYNRRHFDLRLIEETHRSDRYNQDLSLIMIDFDDFKHHNDTYGHQTGDKILKEVAGLIQKSIRKSDMVFRYGGDEFIVLVPGCNLKQAEQIANALVKQVDSYHFENLEGQPLTGISISCGVTCYTGSPEAFVTEADKCLLQAKSHGKGVVVARTCSLTQNNTNVMRLNIENKTTIENRLDVLKKPLNNPLFKEHTNV